MNYINIPGFPTRTGKAVIFGLAPDRESNLKRKNCTALAILPLTLVLLCLVAPLPASPGLNRAPGSGPNHASASFRTTTRTVGSSAADYPTLKLAFDDINAGLLTGDVVLQVTDNTTEIATALLNASGSGSASYSSVLIYPTVSGKTISGDLAAPLIDLNGADNVTIDGRVNQSGTTPDLSLINASTSSAAGTSTVRFINDATYNSVSYCLIKGSTPAPESGVIFLSTTSGTSGNDHNSIEYNKVTNHNNNRPVNALFAKGSAGCENDHVMVRYNEFFEVLHPGLASACVKLSDHNSAYTVSGNSFYETMAFAPTADVNYNVIHIDNAGTSYSIDGNYIGGNGALCSGTWTKTTGNNGFTSILVENDTSVCTNSITGNTIRGFAFTNNGDASWGGIVHDCPESVNGMIGGNTIGSGTGTGSIVIQNTGANVMVMGIDNKGDTDVNDNVIGSITLSADPDHAFYFFGITTNQGDDYTCSGNVIGSETTPNSIIGTSISEVSLSANPDNYQLLIGLNLMNDLNLGSLSVSGNAIANLTNNIQYDYEGIFLPPVCGILASGDALDIHDNSIHDLTADYLSNAWYINLALGGAVTGVFVYPSDSVVNIHDNEIYGLNVSNTANMTYPISACGIQLLSSTQDNVVSNNHIHGINVNSTSGFSQVSGIQNFSSKVSYYNNVISLGTEVSSNAGIAGIYNFNLSGITGAETFFNTISIEGAAFSVAGPSYAYRASTEENRVFKDNLLSNTRSGGSEICNYAMGLSEVTGLSIDYNNYYVSGPTCALGDFNGTDISSLAAWQASTGGDAHSLALDPQFANPGASYPEAYMPGLLLEGIAIPTVPEDFTGTTRNDPPTMGAFEFEPGTIYVNHASTGNNDGSSWADAFTSLQSALSLAGVRDQIWIAGGTYYPSSAHDQANTPRNYHFRLKPGVEVYGGFAGTEGSLGERTAHGPGTANETILNGDIGTPGNTADNCYHVFLHPNGLGLDGSTVLDGVTITGGNANNGTSMADVNNFGGGMFNLNCSPYLRNVFFTQNYGRYGGALANHSAASPTLSNCALYQNTAYTGGAVQNVMSANPVFINTTIAHNTATSHGGGINNYIDCGSILNNCIVWGNTAVTGRQFALSGGTVTSATLDYSCYANGTNDVYVAAGTFNAAASCTTQDPLLVGPAEADFRIYGNSPVRDAGSNLYNAETFDILGRPRVQDGGIDMGACEWTQGVDPDSRTIHVWATAAGSNDGSDWSNAFNALQTALNSARDGDQIWVAQGLYHPTAEPDGSTDEPRRFTFQMKDGVEIYGGFAGTESSPDQRTDFGLGGANETILSGDLSGNDVFDAPNWGYQNGTGNDNCNNLFYHPSSLSLTASAVLDGFTITGGNANSGPYRGSGMYNENCSPTIRNTAFTHNKSNSGGTLYYYESNGVQLENLVFVENHGGDGSGGLALFEMCTATLTNALFSHNWGVDSGGIENFNSTTTITNATFAGNSVLTNGGAISNTSNGTMYLNNCVLWGNTAEDEGNQIYHDGNATILNHTCYSNDAGDIYGTITLGSGNITTDPVFVDPATRNYRLYGNSPCVDAGDNSYNTMETDIRGESRIQNTTIDLGAYEWTSGIDPANRTIYVNVDAAGTDDGSSWGNAFSSLQSALDTALGEDQIWVARGTYYPSFAYGTGATPRYYHFSLKDSVSMYGGFLGNETDPGQRSEFGFGEANETILSGDLGTPGDNSDNCLHVILNTADQALSPATLLDGFTIRDANANGGGMQNFGAGMMLLSSSPILQNLTFANNSASSQGAGLYVTSGSPILDNATFLDNTSVGSGGGAFFINNSMPVIRNSRFTGNSGSSGGGLCIGAGGASAEIENCVFSSNHALITDGGGLWVNGAALSGNQTSITNCLFYGNSSLGNGAGIYLENLLHATHYQLTNVTIADNNASLNGGGIYYHSYYDTNVANLNNCVIWGNTASTSANQMFLTGPGTVTMNYCDYANGADDIVVGAGPFNTANQNINANPVFVDASANDFRLFGNSPCVNAGNNAYNATEMDIRGESRIQNATIDLGAYEWTSGTDPETGILELDPPQNLALTVADGSLTLSWDAVPDAAHYKIYAADAPDGDFALIDTVAGHTWTHPLVANWRFYRVTAASE